jgi:UDP-2,3-diacylglucosamine hydrolase
MQVLQKTWFISDLHLDVDHPEITSDFIKLLGKSDKSVDAIYILGDLFETWIGDDDTNHFSAEMMGALKRLTQNGSKVYFMRGNRDFLIGRQFMAKTGCELLPDEKVVNLYGTRVLLMHGDTLCTKDTAYLRARKFAHYKIIQTLFLWLPLCFRQKIAATARAASHKHTQNIEKYVMDVTDSEVTSVMRHHQVNYLIHGHTHRPDMHHFNDKTEVKYRIVLPAWHDGGSIFEWREDGEKQQLDINQIN